MILIASRGQVMIPKSKMITEKKLRRMYCNKKMNQTEIAKVFGVCNATIHNWMRRCDIPIRTMTESKIGCDVDVPSGEDLRRMYWDNKMSTPEIGEFVGVSGATIRNWMQRYNISMRMMSKSKICCDVNVPDKEDLYQMYWNDRMSAPGIGKLIGVSGSTIRNWMQEYGIPSRTVSESLLGCDVNVPGEKELRIMYQEEKMSMSEIGETVGVSNATIHRWMQRYGISSRTKSEARLINRGKNCYNVNDD